MKIVKIYYIIVTAILILFLTDVFLYFFINEEINSYKTNGLEYNVKDPLLGWDIEYNSLPKNIVFKTNCNSLKLLNCEKNTYKIYISGGSASDLTFDKDNWPIYLFEELVKANYCVELYIGAVRGYNSGQELLKILRDLSCIEPHLHISYSGANEFENPSFTSNYELNNYRILNNVNKHQIPFPNILKLFNNRDNTFSNETLQNADEFWFQNQKIMHAISLMNNRQFIGILQPVSGFSGVSYNIIGDEPYINYLYDYEAFYPMAQSIANENPFIYNFTNIFYEANENPFKDDCHLKSVYYQRIIAQNVYNLIEEEVEYFCKKYK